MNQAKICHLWDSLMYTSIVRAYLYIHNIMYIQYYIITYIYIYITYIYYIDTPQSFDLDGRVQGRIDLLQDFSPKLRQFHLTLEKRKGSVYQ